MDVVVLSEPGASSTFGVNTETDMLNLLIK